LTPTVEDGQMFDRSVQEYCVIHIVQLVASEILCTGL